VPPAQVLLPRRSLTVQVHRLQDESETAAERYAGATAELGTAVSRYQAGARRLDAARSDLDKQRTRSRLRVRAMWEGGGTLGMLSGALRSGDIGSLSSRLAAVRHVTQDDYDKMLAAASAAGKARELATALDALALRQTQLRGKAQAALQTAQAGADAQRTLLARAGQDVAVLVEQQRQDEASRSAAAFRARLTAAIGAARAASAVRVARAAQAAAAARAAAARAAGRSAHDAVGPVDGSTALPDTSALHGYCSASPTCGEARGPKASTAPDSPGGPTPRPVSPSPAPRPSSGCPARTRPSSRCSPATSCSGHPTRPTCHPSTTWRSTSAGT